MKTSNVDLVSKLVVFFTLRAAVQQTDVSLGKSRDFRALQSSLGLPIESLSLFSKNFFFLYEINFYTSYLTILYISLPMWSFDFLNFLNNLSRTLIFVATSPSNHSCEFCFIRLDLIGATRSMTPMTFWMKLE